MTNNMKKEEIKPLDKMPKDFGKAKQLNELNSDDINEDGSVVMKSDEATSNPDKLKKLTDKGINVTLTKENKIDIQESELRKLIKENVFKRITKKEIIERITKEF